MSSQQRTTVRTTRGITKGGDSFEKGFRENDHVAGTKSRGQSPARATMPPCSCEHERVDVAVWRRASLPAFALVWLPVIGSSSIRRTGTPATTHGLPRAHKHRRHRRRHFETLPSRRELARVRIDPKHHDRIRSLVLREQP